MSSIWGSRCDIFQPLALTTDVFSLAILVAVTVSISVCIQYVCVCVCVCMCIIHVLLCIMKLFCWRNSHRTEFFY